MADVVHQKFGLVTQTSRAVEESAPLGAELLSVDGWTSTDWTGDFASGFDHNTGNTTALLNSLAAVSDNYYQIVFTVTGRTDGSFTIAFGGVTSGAYSATGTWGPKATSTGSLSITPTSTFDGTIVISIKQITGAYDPVYKILNSAAGLALEIRSTTNNLYNTFIGVDVGRYNTTGYQNTALGFQALCYNTTGKNNIAVGYAAGWKTGASADNQTSEYSIYIGDDTRSGASGNTNETVIGKSAVGNGSNTVTLGNTSVTGLYMGATKLIGVQGAAVADATGTGDVVAQLNTLLARIRAHGLIAT